jgi:glycosyltransferase involved in cell wall biosynthesis
MPHTTPLVSIITPAFNAGKTLGRAIDSVLAQTYTNWEMIIVDDGSQDNTWDIAQAYSRASSKVTCLWQANAGPASARNSALSQARGEYIALLDADDECLPHRLDVEVDYLLRNQGVTVVGSGAIEIDATSNKRLGVSRLPSTHAELIRTMYYRTPFFAPTVMARRLFFEQMGGFDPSRRYGEDHDLWLRGAANGNRCMAFTENLRRAQDIDLWIRGSGSFIYANIPSPLIRYRRKLQPKRHESWCVSKLMFRHCVVDQGLLSGIWFATRPLIAYLVNRIYYSVCGRTTWLRRLERE